MSTVVEGVKAPVKNGSTAVEQAPSTPRIEIAYFVAPVAWAAALTAFVVTRRRRQRAAAAAKPSVDWKFSFLSGNEVKFQPTLAPRLGVMRLGRGGRRGAPR